MKILTRLLALLFALAAGAVYGIAGSFGHSAVLGGFPIGVFVAVIGAVAFVLAVRLLTDRWAGMVAAAGLVLLMLLFSGQGPGGSVVAPADSVATLVWTIATPALVAVIVAWPRLEDLFDGGSAAPQPARAS